jgi:gas vesicle protein GvpL/GvpF
MLYLYALVTPAASLPPTTGVGGHELALLVVDRVAAVVGEVDGPLEPTHEHLLEHARVVDEIAASNDALLPVRFGRGFHDAGELALALAELSAELEERLRAVEGCVELGVHASEAGAEETGSAGGSRYMQRRLREVTRVAEIHSALAERARESTRDTGTGTLLNGAYLVPRRAVDEFVAAVEQLRRHRPEVTVACTGPWPPYSFASVQDGP